MRARFQVSAASALALTIVAASAAAAQPYRGGAPARAGSGLLYATTPSPLGTALSAGFPEVDALPSAVAVRNHRLQALRRDALKLQAQDGGRVNARHTAMLQARYDAIVAR